MLATKAGDIDLRIPKLRKGSFFSLILEPAGVSTRRCTPW
jgi:transposase-like protein